MTLPLKRFHNVIAPVPAPKSWFDKEVLTLAEIKAHLGDHPSAAFVSYSVGCADYIAAPRLTDVDSRWSFVEVSERRGKKTVKVKVETLTLDPASEMVVFKRDGNRFVQLDVVEAEGGGLFDFVTDLGNMTASQASVGAEGLTNQAQGVVSPVLDKLDKLDTLLAQVGSVETKLAEANTKIDQVKTALSSASGADVNALREERKQLLKQVKTYTDQIRELRASIAKIRSVAKTLTHDVVAWAQGTALAQNRGWSAFVSALPLDACKIPSNPREGVAALNNCRGHLNHLPSREVGIAGMSERQGKHCKNVNSKNLKAKAVCTARVRAENLTLLLQKESKSINGWRLFAPLQLNSDSEAGEREAVSLGREEGVRRGDVFYAVRVGPDGREEKLGHTKVQSVGPGGMLGLTQPSGLAWRTGSAEVGTKMMEHPRIGVSIEAGFKSSVATSTNLDASTLLGLSAVVGYDLTPYLDIFHELWVRTTFDILLSGGEITPTGSLAGAPVDTRLLTFGFFLGPEAKWYLTRRLEVFTQVGLGLMAVSASNTSDSEDSASGSAFSILLGAGFDLVLTADWFLRTGLAYRINTSAITLSNEDNTANSFEGRSAGPFSGLNLSFGLGFIF